MSESTQTRLKSELEHPYRFQTGGFITDKYRVLTPLGFGGFAEVYQCEDLGLDRQVAVKVFTKYSGEIHEAKIAAKLRHSHIVTVHSISHLPDQTAIIVFEYIQGITLEDRLNQVKYRRLNLDETILRMVRQIADALDYAHRQGVIHRDIKPSNILLDFENKPYLTDFGLASVKQPKGTSMLSKDIRDQLSGTLSYMSPEQLLEKGSLSESSDLYSFGVVVYEMLTGRLPYQGRDTRLVIQIANGEILPPTVANPELPQGIEEVLLKILNREPGGRYKTAQEFFEALESVSKAYATANTLHEQAMELVEKRRWREALARFEQLEKQAPGHKETSYQLDQVRQKVRLLDLADKAETLLKEKQYQEALKTLELLEQVDPTYEINDLRKQAIAGREEEEKRSLAQLYEQAVKQFQAEDYQATLDTLAVVWQRNPTYPDAKGIGSQAQDKVDYQKHLRQLYNQGVDQSRKEEWADALQTFEELSTKQPGYEDVNLRLSTALHFHELSSLLESAKGLLQQEKQYASAIDALDGIKQKNKNYKTGDIAHLRQEAEEKLFRRSEVLTKEQNFADALTTLSDLRKRNGDFPGLSKLEAEAQEGLRKQNLRTELDALYNQATAQLAKEAYVEALKTWNLLQQKQEDIVFYDPREIEGRAKGGLYNNAYTALKDGNPKQALALWQQIRQFDPEYKDTKNVETEAKAAIARKVMVRQWAIRIGVGLVVVLLLWIGGNALFDKDDTVTPTATQSIAEVDVAMTQTAVSLLATTSTRTPTPSPSNTATRTATSTATPTIPTNTPTARPSTTPSPTHTATPDVTASPTADPTQAEVTSDASIFSEPDTNATVLGLARDGDVVEVLGKSSTGAWLFIRTKDGTEGFIILERLVWSGDLAELEVFTSVTAPLSVSLQIIGQRCEGSNWIYTLRITGQGGTGSYIYFHNGVQVDGPTNGSFDFEAFGQGATSINAQGEVESGGKFAFQNLILQPFTCN